ncbi:hypothetical protein BJX63DRAFT_6445 [Aspergillus granulosus]|uniref:Uncharacterized protein n=1 Tax=Aspergillus granulosus TaxID=176169 RepID=A0ABR4I5S1_9EURO
MNGLKKRRREEGMMRGEREDGARIITDGWGGHDTEKGDGGVEMNGNGRWGKRCIGVGQSEKCSPGTESPFILEGSLGCWQLTELGIPMTFGSTIIIQYRLLVPGSAGQVGNPESGWYKLRLRRGGFIYPSSPRMRASVPRTLDPSCCLRQSYPAGRIAYDVPTGTPIGNNNSDYKPNKQSSLEIQNKDTMHLRSPKSLAAETDPPHLTYSRAQAGGPILDSVSGML